MFVVLYNLTRVIENPLFSSNTSLLKYWCVILKDWNYYFLRNVCKYFHVLQYTHKYLLVTGIPKIIVPLFHSRFTFHFIQSILLVIPMIINTIDPSLARIYTARKIDVAVWCVIGKKFIKSSYFALKLKYNIMAIILLR